MGRCEKKNPLCTTVLKEKNPLPCAACNEIEKCALHTLMAKRLCVSCIRRLSGLRMRLSASEDK